MRNEGRQHTFLKIKTVLMTGLYIIYIYAENDFVVKLRSQALFYILGII